MPTGASVGTLGNTLGCSRSDLSCKELPFGICNKNNDVGIGESLSQGAHGEVVSHPLRMWIVDRGASATAFACHAKEASTCS